jgi:hypothetical protein
LASVANLASASTHQKAFLKYDVTRQTLNQCFSTGVPRNPRVPWGSSKGSAKFENTAKLGKECTFEHLSFTLSFLTFSQEVCIFIPMPLANLWRKAFKQCISVNKILLKTLGVPQTFLCSKGVPQEFLFVKRVPRREKG